MTERAALGLRRPSAVASRLAQTRRAALDLVYPPRCPVTDEPVGHHGAFSAGAWARMRQIGPPQCGACGLPFAMTDPAAPLCAPCAAPEAFPGALTGPKRLGRVRSGLIYDDEAARLIMGLKYGDRHDHAPALSRLLARAADGLLDAPSLLVPVPLHKSRLRGRRFNQAAILAAGLAKVSGQDRALRLMVRTKATPKQKGLGTAARRRNVAGAFAMRGGRRIEGARVVLVDDVLTSGATLLACARTLRRAGAASVDALTLARVLRD